VSDKKHRSISGDMSRGVAKSVEIIHLWRSGNSITKKETHRDLAKKEIGRQREKLGHPNNAPLKNGEMDQ